MLGFIAKNKYPKPRRNFYPVCILADFFSLKIFKAEKKMKFSVMRKQNIMPAIKKTNAAGRALRIFWRRLLSKKPADFFVSDAS